MKGKAGKANLPRLFIFMVYQTTPRTKETIAALWRLEKIILDSLNFNEVVQEICDSVLLELGYLKLGYQIVVLCLTDQKDRQLKRIAISHTKKARQAIKESPIPFHEIVIPLSYRDNILIKTMRQKAPHVTRKWPDILMPSFSEDEALKIQKSLGIRTSIVYPVLARNKAIGALIFSMSKDPIEVSADEKDLIRSFSDIVGLAVQNASLYTKLEEATQKLEKANRDLRRLDRLKDEFVFIATHELKNPVTAMRGYLSMIGEGSFGKVPDKLKEAVDQLNISNLQLVNLVNDLLQIARSEAKTLTISAKEFDLCPLIEQLVESLKPLAQQKKLDLTHDCVNTELKVMADPDRVKEVVNNLVSNAIKYSEKGTIRVSHIIQNGLAVTHVADQGVGISEDDQKKIFTRFFRAEEEVARGTPGTGLGLFIVKQLVEKMKGKIWFTSQLGKGSTFSFSLPMASQYVDRST
ncbi:hypothetical protein A2783_02135 [Microgenomates group bacterium RIFCSPHIGHO2_01_FULL_45_11]|nr:MAG: hypothetical protein A2783_02135 [Microgenomates group bacterium RIFCSPHIGHO2_01_FULL_45_11]